VLRVLRAEGLAAALDRVADRAVEWRHERRATKVRPGALGHAPVVNVIGFPAVARLGGVPLQLRHRLAYESSLRPVALLAPYGGGWRLDRREGADHRALAWDARRAAAAAMDDPGLEDAISRALEETGAGAVHFEGLAGLAPRSAFRAAAHCEVLITVHDFTPWCPRPHLWEAPAARFCGFSRDEARCHAFLRADFVVPRGFERDWRAAMADLLGAANAIVYPSEYLRNAWRDQLPRLDQARQHVVEPGATQADALEPRPAGPVRHVALVGAVTTAKGAALLPEIVRATDGLRFTVLGGGDAPLLRELRRLPNTRVRGYYRAGSLPAHLSARRIDVALLLSLVPESYGLTLDECWQAGVPAVAFDHGAIAERIRRLGGGLLVPLEQGAAGVIETLRALRSGGVAAPPVPPRAALATPGQAARAHLELYRRLASPGIESPE
jgi:glycosyltransferase involved in cell wall biosynthesis